MQKIKFFSIILGSKALLPPFLVGILSKIFSGNKLSWSLFRFLKLNFAIFLIFYSSIIQNISEYIITEKYIKNEAVQ